MNLLANSVAVLNAGLKQVGGEAVTYRRGGEAIEQLVVVFTNPRNQGGGDVVPVSSREQDAIIWASDLQLGSVPWIPQRGDQIDRIDASGNKQTFDVLPRDQQQDQRCYRYTDASRQQYRVFCVETMAQPDAGP